MTKLLVLIIIIIKTTIIKIITTNNANNNNNDIILSTSFKAVNLNFPTSKRKEEKARNEGGRERERGPDRVDNASHMSLKRYSS